MNLAKTKWMQGIVLRFIMGLMLAATLFRELHYPLSKEDALVMMSHDGLWLAVPILLSFCALSFILDALFSTFNLVKPNKNLSRLCDKINRWRLVTFLSGIFPSLLVARYAYINGFDLSGGTSIFYIALTTSLFIGMIVDVLLDNAKQTAECKKIQRSTDNGKKVM